MSAITPLAAAPALDRVDHIHLQVADRPAALAWYQRVLGLLPVPELAVWATAEGPLTVGDASGRIHLALFQGVAAGPRVTVALGVSADDMPRWQAHLARVLGRAPQWVDHGLSCSVYLVDPDGNRFEITCTDPVAVEAGRVLHQRLDAQLALPAEYGEQLTSHLPMALQALYSLGADAATLNTFDAHYRQRFDPDATLCVPAPQAWPAWHQHLGKMAALPRLQAHFRWALAEQGEATVLADALPRLWPGLAAAAMHGPIRLAHALAACHAGETALALAYWAARWQAVPLPAGSRPADEPLLPWGAWLHALQAARVTWPASPSLIAQRMAAAAETSPAFARLAAGPAPGTGGPLTLADALDALTVWAAARYAETADFTVLHLVTGLRALSQLTRLEVSGAPGGSDASGAARFSEGFEGFEGLGGGDGRGGGHAPTLATLWPVVVAAWLAARRPAVPLPTEPAPDWPALRAATWRSRDDHVIKLVAACLQGWQAQPAHEAVWRAAAWRAVAGENRRA